VGLTVRGLTFYEFKLGDLHEIHTVATWNLENFSIFSWRQRETKIKFIEMAGPRTFRMHTDF
jgi:hypothetical protein